MARANTISNYKYHQTLKYLIGISPSGSIVYVSKSYSGRWRDKFIVQNSGFLDMIEENDIILADRGFLTENAVLHKRAKLIMPFFKNGRSQLEPFAIENNRKITSLRFHVERIIGVLRQRFLVLTNRLPLTAMSKKNIDEMYLDYILKIACALVNLSIHPLS